MKHISDPKKIQTELSCLKSNSSIGFIPTMGGLHQGHLSLIERSKKENDITVVSIFLNPTQFNNKNDLATYPSNFGEDQESLNNLLVDFLFTPSFDNIYPDNYLYEITEKSFSKKLCGANRPGHFNGVLTVVMKLLNIVRPTKSYFGEKDFQQLELIKGLVEAFFIPTQIVSLPTVRDEKGLALSSRNKKLSKEGIQKAQFFANQLNSKSSIDEIAKALKAKKIKIDYIKERDERRFGAVQIENVRLIDNVPI